MIMKTENGSVQVSTTGSGPFALTLWGHSAGSHGTVIISAAELAQLGAAIRDAAWHVGGAQ